MNYRERAAPKRAAAARDRDRAGRGPAPRYAHTYRIGNSTAAAASCAVGRQPAGRFRDKRRLARIRKDVAHQLCAGGPRKRSELRHSVGSIRRPTHTNTRRPIGLNSRSAAHKWIDISDRGYGVALLNDCKYGYRVQGNVLDLNLLRSPGHPDPSPIAPSTNFTLCALTTCGRPCRGRRHARRL